jgi:NAD-dependent deacetylase sirtuin 7
MQDLLAILNVKYYLDNIGQDIVFYTGAGISTSAAIPDYRGDEGLKNKPKPMIVIGLQEAELDYKMPTYSHVAIQQLVEKGIAKFIVTSNHDNMHQKAGTTFERICRRSTIDYIGS